MTTHNDIQPSDPSGQMDDTPPFFNKWSEIYWLVIIILLVMVGMFYLFATSFA